ncbi:hypothetical protein [Amycolatopsis sp. NPDC001319]|uniref:hypothetical protein n=1 Tax=unclassified Amycolatopsis TaxID=2618356 RepID=UPI00368A205D
MPEQTDNVDLSDSTHPVWVAVCDTVPLAAIVEAVRSSRPEWDVSTLISRAVKAALVVVGYPPSGSPAARSDRADIVERAAWAMWRADGSPSGVAKRDPYRKLARALADGGFLSAADEAREPAPAARTLLGLALPAHIHTGRVGDEGKLWCAKHKPQPHSAWTSDADELRAFLRDHAHAEDAGPVADDRTEAEVLADLVENDRPPAGLTDKVTRHIPEGDR